MSLIRVLLRAHLASLPHDVDIATDPCPNRLVVHNPLKVPQETAAADTGFQFQWEPSSDDEAPVPIEPIPKPIADLSRQETVSMASPAEVPKPSSSVRCNPRDMSFYLVNSNHSDKFR